MAEVQWFYARDGQAHGPISETALREMLSRGEVGAVDLVWRDGMANWEFAGRVPGLLPSGAVPPPLPVNYLTPAPEPMEESAAMRMLLPVGRSGWAIAAGYLGLFSVLAFPAPFAVICAIIAIRDIRAHPKRHGMGRAIFGLVMGLGCSVLLLVLLIRVATR